MLKRPKIALALPSYDRQRLSGIRRGWCPSLEIPGDQRVARSDAGDAHRLSLSEALSISENRSSQGETTVRKRFPRLSKSPFAALTAPSGDMGRGLPICQLGQPNEFISGLKVLL
jgi:hypothetical protein